jgi:thiosulfate/3-mercaptopyruvate sulfurtransferase
VRVVDASWYMPDEKRAPAKEFEAGHIPGAVFFDIDGIADHATDLPHMMPSPGEFSKAVGALGIGDGEMVVAYDGSACFRAACLGGCLEPWATRASRCWTADSPNGNVRAARSKPGRRSQRPNSSPPFQPPI